MTEQLEQWRGEFGDEYVDRNLDLGSVFKRAEMFSVCLKNADIDIQSFMEFGGNIGLNGLALKFAIRRDPPIEIFSIEPNDKARQISSSVYDKTWPSLQDAVIGQKINTNATADLVFTCGVLIHIPDSDLRKTMRQLVDRARKYILAIEYFNPTPVEIEYRGKAGMLWKRDYGSEYLSMGLKCVDYGFFWKPETGLDDLNWWLLSK